MRSWALALAERRARVAAARPRGGEPARGPRRCCSQRDPHAALAPLRRPAAVLAAADRAGRGEAPVRRRARRRPRADGARGPRRCSRRPRSTFAAARSSTRDARSPRQSHAVASEIGDAHREWRALQFLGEFGVAGDDVDVAVPWLERALALARSESDSRPPRRSASIRSASPRWMRGDLRERRPDLVAESIEAFRALEGSTGDDSLPAQHRRDPDEPARAAARACSTSSRTRCSRSSRSPATRRPATRLRTRPAIARARGDIARRAALLDESDARFAAAGRRRRAWRRSPSAAPTPRSPSGRSRGGARAARASRSTCAARLGDRRGRGLVLSGLGMVETIAGDYDRAERASRRGPRHLPARGRPLGPREHALAHRRPRGRAGRPRRAPRPPCKRRCAVLGETQRERWIASTLAGLAEVALLRGDVEQAPSSSRDARDRYAARDDALGVATIDERLRSLAKWPLRQGKGAPDTHFRAQPRRKEEGHDARQSPRSSGKRRCRSCARACGGEIADRRRRGVRRGVPGLERRPRRSPPGAHRPLRRRRRRGRRGRLRAQQRPDRSPCAAAATASPASRPATTGS